MVAIKSEIIERVALAIFTAEWGTRPEQWSEHERLEHIAMAFAAIGAMAEPTDEMLVSALQVTRSTRYGPCDDCVGSAVYRAMINSSLKGSKRGDEK